MGISETEIPDQATEVETPSVSNVINIYLTDPETLAAAIANASVNVNGGNPGSGTTQVITQPVPGPTQSAPVGGPRMSGGFVVPGWFGPMVCGLALLIAAAVAAILLYNWVNDDNSSEPTTVITSVPGLLISEHFLTNHHAVCGIAYVNDGSAYRIKFKRRGTCGNTVDAVLPVDQVRIPHAASIYHNNARLLYSSGAYDLSSSDIEALQDQNLAVQVKDHLKLVVVQLTPAAYHTLQASK